MIKSCRHCSHPVPDGTVIGRTTLCESCGSPLHTCRNCRFFEPGAYHDCKEASDELIADKDAANFCDLFSLGSGTQQKKVSDDARAKAEALFKF